MAGKVVVQVTTPELQDIEPVQFVTVLGVFGTSSGAIAVETPDSIVVTNGGAGVGVRINTQLNSSADIPGIGFDMDSTFGSPQAITVEPDGSLVVVEVFPLAVIRLPASGSQQGMRIPVITDFISCSSLSEPRAITIEASGAFIVAEGFFFAPAVVQIDSAGQCTTVSEPPNGNFQIPRSITVDKTDGSLVLVDEISHTIVRVDPVSGNGTPDFSLPDPRAVAFDETNGSLIVVDAMLRAVVRVDQQGIHTISGCTVSIDPAMPCPSDALVGRGPLFLIPEAVAVEPGGRVWVLDGGLQAVVRVDVQDGKRFIVHFLRQ